MPHEVMEIRGEVIRLRLSGLLTSADMTSLQKLALQLISQGMKPRLLAILDNFQGWSRHDDWNEIEFLKEHGDDVTRMAVVGDDKWKDDIYLFVGKGFRTTEIEFFSAGALEQAEKWVACQGQRHG